MSNIFKSLFSVLVIVLLSSWPVLAFAYDHNGNWHNNGHEDHGYHGYHDHSYVGINFSAWPNNYYYGGPYYYPSDDVLVSPSVYEPVVINGATYYLNNGQYFIYNGYGYQAVNPPTVIQEPAVVEAPVVVEQSTVATPAAEAPEAPEAPEADSVTINIPNDKGGFTAVTLKKSGNGYLGPQGEFYSDFPKVSVLQVVYGK